MKEGQPSLIRTPGTDSPVHRSKPRTDRSPVRAEKPLSPEKPQVSPVKEDYEDDFEGTNENVSSLEEDRRREAREGKLERMKKMVMGRALFTLMCLSIGTPKNH